MTILESMVLEMGLVPASFHKLQVFPFSNSSCRNLFCVFQVLKISRISTLQRYSFMRDQMHVT